MKPVKTSALTGTLLDWVVAKCDGYRLDLAPEGSYTPSTDWAQGGLIIERERINTYATPIGWDATRDLDMLDFSRTYRGLTPLIAAMRCYVASKLGETVEIPEELTK